MEEFPSPPLPPMYAQKPQEQQVKGEKHLRKQGLKVPKAKCFSSSDIDSLAPEVTYVYSCNPPPPQPKQNLTQNGRWETHSVSYHSDLTLQYPSGLNHLHWNICLVKQAGKCLCLEQ